MTALKSIRRRNAKPPTSPSQLSFNEKLENAPRVNKGLEYHVQGQESLFVGHFQFRILKLHQKVGAVCSIERGYLSRAGLDLIRLLDIVVLINLIHLSVNSVV